MFALSRAAMARDAAAEQARADASDASELAQPVRVLPTTPWAFLAHFAREGFVARYVSMMAAVVLAQICQTLDPYVLKLLINRVTAALGIDVAARASVTGPIFGLFGLMVALWFADTFLVRCYQMIDIYTAPWLRKRVQTRMFGYLLGHSPRYFQENFAGKLGQKVKEAGRACVSIMEMVTFDLTKIVVMLIVSMILLIAQRPQLALLLGGWMVVYLIGSSLLAYRCVGLSKAFSASVSTSSGKLIDAIANADTIRSFARWRHERGFLEEYLETERARSVRLRWFLTVIRIFQSVAVLSMIAGLCWFALSDMLAHGGDLGSFTLVFSLSGLIAMNVWNLSNRMLDFFDNMGTLTEAIELVTQPHEIIDRPGARPLVVTAGRIDVEAVSFAHPDGLTLFDRLTLHIGAGEKVALVGPSGGGKSTFVKLLRRQFEPSAGRILIDGQDIAHVTWDSVNAAIAEVSQAPGVFHRPVGANIRYGRLDADEDALLTAARRAHSHDFIARRPTGYDTIVGEQGIKLSGGEKQRIAIARALLKDARILILDEATSSLDSESEHLIQEALWDLMVGRTVIAIAHRLSTITGMDRIIYLQAGRIVEQGSHAELVARGGAYSRMWRRQVGGFIGAA
ncbi:MAG TPA: ABC transporter ATP-binding protein [Candidatus Sulfotelmatobacter sp.]|nr:ABC transporter ATP-binding protein [Candidatus Sulfotelmatobacter sp.]